MVTLTLALLHRQLLDIPRKSLFSPNPNTSPNPNLKPFVRPLPGVYWEKCNSTRASFIRKTKHFCLLQPYLVWKNLLRWSRKQIQKFVAHWKVAKNRLKEKSSGRMHTKRQNRKVCSSLRSISSSPDHWRTSKLPQQEFSQIEDFQTTLSSRSQLESSAGKPVTSRSTIQTPRQELRTTSPHSAGMKGSATSEGQKDNFFCRRKGLFRASTWSLVCQLHAYEKWRRCRNHNYQNKVGVHLSRYRSMASQRVLIYIVYILKIVCRTNRSLQGPPHERCLSIHPLDPIDVYKSLRSFPLSLSLSHSSRLTTRRTWTWSCLQLITKRLFTTVLSETTLEPFTNIVNDRTHCQALH